MIKILLSCVAAVIAVLGVFKILTVISRRRNKWSRYEASVYIENFLTGGGGSWDFDDFLTLPHSDPLIDRIQGECRSIPEVYPPSEGEIFCNEEGVKRMWELIDMLREEKAEYPKIK